jgi:hypothetical protein
METDPSHELSPQSCRAVRCDQETVVVTTPKSFSLDQAKTIGEELGLRWDSFDPEQFRAGLDVELEHGTVNQTANVTHDDPLMTGKIALAHLTDCPDYYTRLANMETEAQKFWRQKR